MLKYSFYNNYELLTGGHVTASHFDIVVDGNTLLKGSYFLNALIRRWSSWGIFIVGDQTIEEARTYFKSMYLDFWEYRKNDLKQVLTAWSKEYDPLTNYDRYEEGGWVDELHKGSKTSHAVDTKTSTATDTTDTETPTIKTKTTNYTVGDDNASAMESGHNVTEIESGNTTIRREANANNNYNETKGEASKNYDTIEDISEDQFDHNKRIFDNYHVYGNIGIKGNAQLAIEELEKALKPVVDMFIKQFVDSYELLVD